MGITFARGSIAGKTETREYDFLVDTGATWIGLPSADIDALELDIVPNATAPIMTGNGVIDTPIYVAVGMLEGTGFVNGAVPTPAHAHAHAHAHGRVSFAAGPGFQRRPGK